MLSPTVYWKASLPTNATVLHPSDLPGDLDRNRTYIGALGVRCSIH